MSRAVPLSGLRDRARELSDTVGDTNITDAWLTVLANVCIPEVWDILVDAGPPERYAATTAPIAFASGVTTTGLPADFRNLLDVFVIESNGDRTRVPAMNPGARARYRASMTPFNVELEYIPMPIVLADPGEAFDGISGWEELVCVCMAYKVAEKRDDLGRVATLKEDAAVLKARINSTARSYDKGSPKRVTDLDETDAFDFWMSSARTRAYRLRGQNIEIYERAVWP